MPIYFVQHGVAVPEEVDPNRPLSTEGRREVEAIAAHLRETGITVKKVCHSGKLRARETAQIFAGQIGGDNLCEVPGMNPNDAVRRLAGALEDDTMYVGHLPHLGRLVSYLVTGNETTEVVQFVNAGVVCVAKGSAGYHVAWYVKPPLPKA
ncbi:MAG: phosphohistidine phosphatase SixA [Thermodesulfobacteriota bacterium]